MGICRSTAGCRLPTGRSSEATTPPTRTRPRRHLDERPPRCAESIARLSQCRVGPPDHRETPMLVSIESRPTDLPLRAAGMRPRRRGPSYLHELGDRESIPHPGIQRPSPPSRPWLAGATSPDLSPKDRRSGGPPSTFPHPPSGSPPRTRHGPSIGTELHSGRTP